MKYRNYICKKTLEISLFTSFKIIYLLIDNDKEKKTLATSPLDYFSPNEFH